MVRLGSHSRHHACERKNAVGLPVTPGQPHRSDRRDKRKRLQPLIDADLAVFDDLFLARQLPTESADTLQSILHRRYKLRRSSLITSNRIIDDWHKFLGDAALATAILDRLLHRSVLLEFKGRSYRLKEAANRLAKTTHSE